MHIGLEEKDSLGCSTCGTLPVSPALVLGSARDLLDSVRGCLTWVLCISFGFPFQNVIINLLFKKKIIILLLLSGDCWMCLNRTLHVCTAAIRHGPRPISFAGQNVTLWSSSEIIC